MSWSTLSWDSNGKVKSAQANLDCIMLPRVERETDRRCGYVSLLTVSRVCQGRLRMAPKVSQIIACLKRPNPVCAWQQRIAKVGRVGYRAGQPFAATAT